MPLVFFVLLVLLIVQVGFWKTFAAVIGATVMLFILFPLLLAVALVGGLLFLGRR